MLRDYWIQDAVYMKVQHGDSGFLITTLLGRVLGERF